MTVVATIPFVPSNVSAPQFQVTLDGEAYTATVTWNLFGQRYYVNFFTVNAERILSIPMVGSPNDYDISLTAGYFTTQVVWRVQSRQFEIIEP